MKHVQNGSIMQVMGGGKGEKREKNDQALKNAQTHMLNVNGIMYMYILEQ